MLGLWIWADSLSASGAEKVFDDCALIGATDVFFLSKGLSGRCAFKTELAPAVSEGRDLLAEAVRAAHTRGIRLQSWFTSAQDANYCATHPNSGLYHFRKGASKETVSIADAAYARYMRRLIGELLQRYPVDGIHLDYVRYNHLLYGWSEADKARYAQSGVDVARACELIERTFYGKEEDAQAVFDAYRSGDGVALALANARIRDVCRFADAVLEGVRNARKDIILSAALMPEGAYDTAFADLHYGQSYRELCRRFDIILPMAYSVAYGREADWVNRVSHGAIRHGAAVVTGLHAFEGGTGLSLKRDEDAAVSAQGVRGVCLFRYGTSLLAAAQGGALTLTNPMDRPVTRIELTNAEETAGIETSLEPGQRAEIALPFRAETLRAWSDDKEVCAYMSSLKKEA